MSADLQDLFDRAGRNPPASALDADVVLRTARRSGNRRMMGAVAATVAVIVALGVGVASQRLQFEARLPAAPLPTAPALGSLGRLAYGLDGDIYVADADGGNRVRIADGAPSEEGNCGGYWGEGPLWSPDGRYLAYRGEGGEPRPASCNRTVNISTAAGQRVASFPGEGWAISWSPDSTRVVVWLDFYGVPTLGIYGLDGVRQALITVPLELMASGDYDPVWSPDGASILVRHGVEVPLDGSAPRQLPADDPRAGLKATYSPDGSEVAYISRDGFGSPAGLAVAAKDGSPGRLLVPGGVEGYEPGPAGLAWSPTGDRIAFPHQTGAGRTELRVVDVATGTVATVTDVGGPDVLGNLKFSPDGDQILFTRTDTEDEDEPSLWSVRADGSDLHRLVVGTSWGDWQTVPKS